VIVHQQNLVDQITIYTAGNGSIIAMSRLPIDKMVMLYCAADAFVVTSHGEGFGRPSLEAMAMGLPVIATNFSGLTAFVRDDVAFPIPVYGLEQHNGQVSVGGSSSQPVIA